MRTEYKGSSIAIETTHKNGGPWAAVVRVWPVHNRIRALRDQREIEGYKNRGEAEEAGVQWAKERIDSYAQNRLPTL
jgi:hypothetical protein